jgi:hypothetical protein
LRFQRAFSAGLFVLSDLNDEDVPDVTGGIGSDESINLGDDSGFTEKDDSDMGTFIRFSHSLTFFYGFNQENKEISRFTKARGKRLAAAVSKPKQF